MSLKSRLRKALAESDLNQVSLAEEIGVSQQAVQKWLTESPVGSEPRRNKIPIICQTLGISEVWLLTGQGEMYPPVRDKNKLIKEISEKLPSLSLEALNDLYSQIQSR